MAISLTNAPQVWDGSTVDARAWGGLIVTCTVAPSSAWTITGSPDNNSDYLTISCSLNNSSGIASPVTTISGIGIYTIPASQFVKLSGGTGGTFFAAAIPFYTSGGSSSGSSSPSYTVIEGPSGNQAVVLSDGALSVQSIQGPITTMTLVSGTPLALDLTTFSAANISISGLSADTLKVETGMDITSLLPATLLKFSGGSSTMQDATAMTGSAGNGNWSVMGFQGELRFTRTGSADTLTVKVKGTN